MKTQHIFRFFIIAIVTVGLFSSCDDDSSQPGSVCGNGILEDGEQCDDGNTLGSDGCSTNCFLEGLICGDGIVSISEECDDGNNFDGDGCSATCTNETAYCGDGVVNGTEQCDDGNNVSDDGCSATCMNEGPYCGDGVVNGTEQCDDGNNVSGDGCSATCMNETTYCGDGVVNGTEQCDDGNNVSGDGCSATCMNEGTSCGDGTVDFGEECDDGNNISGDGCSADCQSDESCGNYIVDVGEQCDPPNGTSCDSSCHSIAGECDQADTYDTDCSDATTGQWCWSGGGSTLFCGCDPDFDNDDCWLTGYEVCNPATNRCEPAPPCGIDSYESNEDEASAALVLVGDNVSAVTCSDDDDWYQFVAPADATNLIIGAFWVDDGGTDMDLYVTDCAGGVLFSGETEEVDNEILNLDGITPGVTYCVYVSLYSGPVYGTDAVYELLLREDKACFLDSDCPGTGICPATANGMALCANSVQGTAGCGDDVAGDNDRPSLAQVLVSGVTVTEGSCDGNPSNPADLDWFMFTLNAGDAFDLTVDQASGMAAGDMDVVVFDASGLAWAVAATVNNPEIISATGLPAGDYYVAVVYYDNDTLTPASTSYDITVVITSGTGCVDRDDCSALLGHGECNAGLCEDFDGAASQGPGEFCDNDEDCDPASTGSSFISALCFTADPTRASDNVCVVDCDTDTDCASYGMHCAIVDPGYTPAGICLAPCTSDDGCGGLTCNTGTGICEL
ncbi:DUF4215 domain-containing protein [Myxococcota bacterium]|nr:DUF4215 domain-containing protein [Myxococcota bacterium]MBU1537069.1 DUF4215 domain-containing protein [Myxococcota bacterium]